MDPFRELRDVLFLEPRRCRRIGRIETKSGDSFSVDVQRSPAWNNQNGRSPESGSNYGRLARDRIEDVGLLDLGKIGSDSGFLSVLKIHDEHRRRGGIKCFICK